MNFLARLIANGVGIWLASLLLPGFTVAQQAGISEQIVVYAAISLILTLLNLLVRPIVAFLSFPLYVVTFGLFSLVVNAAMLALTAKITEGHSFELSLSGFWTALFGALIVTVVASVVNAVIEPEEKK